MRQIEVYAASRCPSLLCDLLKACWSKLTSALPFLDGWTTPATSTSYVWSKGIEAISTRLLLPPFYHSRQYRYRVKSVWRGRIEAVSTWLLVPPWTVSKPYQNRIQAVSTWPLMPPWTVGGSMLLMLGTQCVQDDAHIFCLPNQIAGEIGRVLDLTQDIMAAFGFHPDGFEVSSLVLFDLIWSYHPSRSVSQDIPIGPSLLVLRGSLFAPIRLSYRSPEVFLLVAPYRSLEICLSILPCRSIDPLGIPIGSFLWCFLGVDLISYIGPFSLIAFCWPQCSIALRGAVCLVSFLHAV